MDKNAIAWWLLLPLTSAASAQQLMSDAQLSATVAGMQPSSELNILASTRVVASASSRVPIGSSISAISAEASGGRSKVIVLSADGLHATVIEAVGSLSVTSDASGHLHIEGTAVTLKTIPVDHGLFGMPHGVGLDDLGTAVLAHVAHRLAH